MPSGPLRWISLARGSGRSASGAPAWMLAGSAGGVRSRTVRATSSGKASRVGRLLLARSNVQIAISCAPLRPRKISGVSPSASCVAAQAGGSHLARAAKAHAFQPQSFQQRAAACKLARTPATRRAARRAISALPGGGLSASDRASRPCLRQKAVEQRQIGGAAAGGVGVARRVDHSDTHARNGRERAPQRIRLGRDQQRLDRPGLRQTQEAVDRPAAGASRPSSAARSQL